MISSHQILSAKILIVEDQKLDALVLERILKSEGYKSIKVLIDAREAAEAYNKWRPDLVVLDLNMPHVDGFGVMEQLTKIEPARGYIPVLVITSEKTREVRLRSFQAGAKDFLNKPYDPLEVAVRIRNMIEVRLLNNQVLGQNRILEEKVEERTHELRETRLDIIHRLARTAEYRDNETGLHVIRMSQYSACVGEAIGLSEAQCELLLNASPLHDIGKIAIPDSILLKPGKLDDQERQIMMNHAAIGAELLSGSSSPLMKMAEIIALSHHEKWDGTGYPRKLKGENIPLVGRICAAADVFDALTSVRPYKKEWPVSEAVDNIKSESGKHFDPKVVEGFLKVLPKIKEIKEKNIEVGALEIKKQSRA